MPKFAALVEDFAGSELDSGKWIVGGDPEVQYGRLSLPIGEPESSITSRQGYDLSSSSVFVKMSLPTYSYSSLSLINSMSSRIEIYVSQDLIYYRIVRAGVVDELRDHFDSSLLWWRIREANGIVMWDTSSDGVSWTTRRSTPHGINVSELTLVIRAVGGSDNPYGEGPAGSGGYGGSHTNPNTYGSDVYGVGDFGA